MNILDVGDRCMRLCYKEGGDSNEYPPASEDVRSRCRLPRFTATDHGQTQILKKVEGYGIDIKQYFDITMDCKLFMRGVLVTASTH